LIALRHLLWEQAGLAAFISTELIQSTTPFPSTISMLRPLDHAISVISDPKILIASVIFLLVEVLMLFLDVKTEIELGMSLLIVHFVCSLIKHALRGAGVA
jgi:hypothetical protein